MFSFIKNILGNKSGAHSHAAQGGCCGGSHKVIVEQAPSQGGCCGGQSQAAKEEKAQGGCCGGHGHH